MGVSKICNIFYLARRLKAPLLMPRAGRRDEFQQRFQTRPRN